MSRDSGSAGRDRYELLAELSDAVRANQRATDVVDDLAGQLLGVNRSDGRCLDILDQRGRLSAGELAREASLTSGAITAVIDRLEQAGYVQRVADPRDRRRVLVETTDRTRDMTEELFGPLAAQAMPLFERYSDQQLELLIEFHRLGVELQERHAEFLRARLRTRERKPA
ncbi:MAG: MarR family transcriptional regulator [Solirubrobacterales bacterium]|nr:MarR family transcriptional regulator [Solirubrobacterales bacterium]